MKDIWNKFGRGILNYYYEKEKTRITFVPYTTYEKVNHSLFFAKLFIWDLKIVINYFSKKVKNTKWFKEKKIKQRFDNKK